MHAARFQCGGCGGEEHWVLAGDDAGREPFVEECGNCHVIEGLTKGGMRKAPQIFGWGSSWWIARMVRNPRTGDPITIPQQETITFSPGQELRSLLNRNGKPNHVPAAAAKTSAR